MTATEFCWPVRVYYEDTDAGGVVFYANYLKFMERARTEWLRSLGFEQDHLITDEGIIFAVRRTQLEYLKPARFNELLNVSVDIERLGAASIAFQQSITNRNREVVCRGSVKIACLDARSLRPTPIPKFMLSGLQSGN
jgi:acyl-CoA thioester hydrolase